MAKRTIQRLVTACLLGGALWAAKDPFIGKWKFNPCGSKQTDVMKVESAGANKYTFDFGAGPETIVTDGTDQAGIYGTTLAVTAEAPDTWKVVRKKDGRMLLTAIWNLSKDGKTLTDHFTGINPNGSTYNLNYVYQRTAGGAGFADRWASTSESTDSVFVLEIKSYQGSGLSFINPSAESTTNVKFDGKDYPTQGPNVPAGFTASARLVSDHTLELTDKRNGKIADTRRVELSSDGKTLTITVRSVGKNEPDILVFERQ